MARKIDPAKGTAILNAARTVFLRDGYAAAKMSDIAAEAGVAPGTLYLYFDSKEALATAIGEDFFLRLSSEFAVVVKKLDKPSGVNVLVDWAVRIATEERDLLVLLKKQGEENERPGEPGPKKIFRRHLSEALQNLMKKNFVRQYDPEPLACVVMSILAGIFQSCVTCETETKIEPIKIAAAKFLQHALFEDKILPEKRSPEKRSPEKRLPEKHLPEKRLSERRLSEKRLSEKRPSKKRQVRVAGKLVQGKAGALQDKLRPSRAR